MPRSGYTPRHSGVPEPSRPAPVPQHASRVSASRRRQRASVGRRRRIVALMAGFALISATAVVAIIRGGLTPPQPTALTAQSCAAPRLAASTSTNTLLGVDASSDAQLAQDTAEFGHMPVLRVYFPGLPKPSLWTTGVQGRNQSSVVVSFRALPSAVLSGADDAALAKFFDSAPTGYPLYWSYEPEPEAPIKNGTFALAPYKSAWVHIAAIAARAGNPYLKPTLILMSYDLSPSSGRNWKNYMPPGNIISVLGWDAYPAGTVEDHNMQATPPGTFMGPAEAASRSVGLPFGFAEFALGTAAGRPAWLLHVADYIRSSGALFGTLFDSTGYPWMYLRDSASISAWRSAIAGTSGGPFPPPPSRPTAKPSRAAPSVKATPSAAPSSASPSPTADAAPTISSLRVDPPAIPAAGKEHVRVLFKLSQPANIAICVASGSSVFREIDRTNQRAGWSSTWYSGYDSAGALLSPGRYQVVVIASNAAGAARAQAAMTIGPIT